MAGPPGREHNEGAGPPAGAPDLSFIEAAAHARSSDTRRRYWAAMGVAVVVTVVWFVGVLVTDSFGRVWDNIVATPTMMFGSFVAGATPQGGGAVGFPVLTKGVGVPSEVARTFSLAIQSIGMTTASIAILVRRRAFSLPAVLWSLPAGLIGLFVGLLLFSDRDTPFWTSVLPGPYVKVFFTLLILAMAFVVFLGSRVPVREVRTAISPLGRRQLSFIVAGAALGGFASSQVGSGSDVLLYLVVVVMLGLEPRIAVPSSVLVMTVVSLVGFIYLGLIQGHMNVVVTGDVVTSVGGSALPDPSLFPAQRYDLLGLWLAAVPVVCWGAPLGSAWAARVSSRNLALFVAVLAVLEGVTTVIFLDELRSDLGLIAFAVIGGLVLVGALYLCVQYRHRLFDVRLDPNRAITRERVDVGPEYLAERGQPPVSKARPPKRDDSSEKASERTETSDSNEDGST